MGLLLGQVDVPQPVSCIIRQYAADSQTPAWLLAGIVMAESGFDPSALGDGGTSYGLLQLHRGGGQGDDYAGPAENLFDPRINLEVGGPYITRAYLSFEGSGLTGRDLIAAVATHSGHPGRIPESDPRVQAIVAATVRLITSPAGQLVPWPTMAESGCSAPPQPPLAPVLWHEESEPASWQSRRMASLAHAARIAELLAPPSDG